MAYPTEALTQSIASTASRTRSTSGFIPELWGDEVIASYEKNLVMGNLVKRIPFAGKKGDTIHVPSFATRGTANSKTAATIVTLNQMQAEETPILIDKHYEYSYLLEDITALQANDAFRQFYTSDAGYALAKQVDQHIWEQTHYFQSGAATPAKATLYETAVIGGDGSTTFDGTANTNTGNGSTLTDAGIRRMMQTLDDQDVPMEGRFLVIPPVERKNLLGLARFTEQAFIGNGTAIQTGNFGNIYGIPVYVSTNCPWLHVEPDSGEQTANFSGTALAASVNLYWDGVQVGATDFTSDTDTRYRIGALFHRDAIALAEQQAIRAQTQYKQEYLADLFTADTVYGVEMLRHLNGVAFVVPS
jgi:N4-gp56 family major capsid protein